jgi:hypothetical protein
MEFTIPPPRTPVQKGMLDQLEAVEQTGELAEAIRILSAQMTSLQDQFMEVKHFQQQQQPQQQQHHQQQQQPLQQQQSRQQQQHQQQQQRQTRFPETPAYSPVFGFETRNQRRSDIESNVGQQNHFRRRSIHLQDPEPQMATGYTQSIVPLNPDTCQVRLNILNFASVFNFIEAMQHLELSHPHEKLQWGRFVTQGVAQMIKAHAEQHGMVSNSIVIRSNYVFLGNDDFLAIILDIVKPLSQAAFVADLKSVVKAITLPNGYVMTSNWTWIYKQILLLISKFKDVLDVLNSHQAQDISYLPSMKSQQGGGKPGLMEIFYSLVPKGKEIHFSINIDQVKACHTMNDYLVLFQGVNEKLYQNSKKSLEDATLLRGSQPLTPSGEINKPAYTAPGAYDTPNPKKLHNNNNNNTKPYHNPYAPKHNNNLSNIYDINNYYDSCDNKNEDDFDAYDTYDYDDSNVILNDTGLNPMYTTNPQDNYPTGEDLYALKTAVIDRSNMPCYSQLRGTCSSGKSCPYSHEDAVLRKEWSSQFKGLMDSPYKDGKSSSSPYYNNPQPRQPSAIQQRPTVTNARPLAALSLTEESSQPDIMQEHGNYRELHDGPKDAPANISMPTHRSRM